MSSEEIKGIHDRLDRLEHISLLAAKDVLNLDEAAMYTGFKKGFIYRLTSEKRIPHYKKGGKLLFRKDELEAWLTENKILSGAEINSRAETYTATHKI